MGDPSIGKRTFLSKYFDIKHQDIEDIHFEQKTMRLSTDKPLIKIQLFMDNTNRMQETWKYWLPLIIDNKHCIIFMFDLTAENTLKSIQRYYKGAKHCNTV